MNVLYVVEIVVFMVAILIEAIVFLKKDSKKALFSFGITLAVFLTAFILTFALEKPNVDLETFQTIEVKSQFSKPKVTYHFQNITNKVEVKGELDTNKIGDYNVTLEIPILTGVYKKNCKVQVVDSKKPNIVLEGDTEIISSFGKDFEEPGYKAFDECDGDLTDKVEISKEEINENEYNLVYNVEDSSGNVEEAKRHITLTDDVPPVISLNNNRNIYLTLNSNYEEPGAKAIDAKDGDVSDTLKIEGTVNTSLEGLYTIKYTASDKNGNVASSDRYVLVSEEGRVCEQDGTAGKKGVIYLTFDDGPSETTTPKILDILDKKGVKATFFVINYGESTEPLIKREHDSGHTVAIHGYSHTYSQIYQSVDSYLMNIEKMREKIKNTIGVDTTITRFPGGSSNTISRHYCQKIMTTLAYEMVSRGYTYFDWNVDSDDAGHAKNSDDVYRNVTSRLSKDKANVVLMHDFSGNTKTMGALEAVIDYGLENGYTFEALTDETAMVTHTTNN